MASIQIENKNALRFDVPIYGVYFRYKGKGKETERKNAGSGKGRSDKMDDAV